jgi:DNA-binding beta-propeller fold protein YncE
VCSFLALAVGLVPAAEAVDDRATEQNSVPLSLVQTVALPRVTGGMNHLAADPKRGRFFITVPGQKNVLVVDLQTGKVMRTLSAPAAAARFLPDLDRLCVSGDGEVHFYAGGSLAPAGTMKLQSSLDELQYDAKAKRLYVGMMDPDKPGIAVIDVPGRRLLAKLKLPAKPQGFVVEPDAARIYANTPREAQVTDLDLKTRSVAAEWKLSGARSSAIG